MASDRRTDEEIRREIASEREQLADSLADLRKAIDDKRALATVVGGALAAGLASTVAVKVLRRFR